MKRCGFPDTEYEARASWYAFIAAGHITKFLNVSKTEQKLVAAERILL
jgi:hypothetical protein